MKTPLYSFKIDYRLRLKSMFVELSKVEKNF